MMMFTQAYRDEIDHSRLAHRVIPEFPLPDSARSVAADKYYYDTGAVDDVNQVSLEERQEPFQLTKAQDEDEDLSSAQVIVRRAAQRMARGDDDRVFKVAIRDPIDAGQGQRDYQNLVDVDRLVDVLGGASRLNGEGLVAATSTAVFQLDADGYRSGYVMVAGQRMYQLLHTRAVGAADLPIVAVRGLLGDGPVHWSTSLPEEEALVMSVGAGRIDRAVAVSPVAEFLRVEPQAVRIPIVPPPAIPPSDEFRLWRLYGRFVTRFKETRSAVLLRLEPAAPAAAGGGE